MLAKPHVKTREEVERGPRELEEMIAALPAGAHKEYARFFHVDLKAKCSPKYGYKPEKHFRKSNRPWHSFLPESPNHNFPITGALAILRHAY